MPAILIIGSAPAVPVRRFVVDLVLGRPVGGQVLGVLLPGLKQDLERNSTNLSTFP
jgi:hypothetical protein